MVDIRQLLRLPLTDREEKRVPENQLSSMQNFCIKIADRRYLVLLYSVIIIAGFATSNVYGRGYDI